MRFVLALLVVIVLAATGVYFVYGRGPAPTIIVHQPQKAIGQRATLDFSVEVPGGSTNHIEASLEQEGRRFPLFSLSQPGDAQLRQETPSRVRITRPFGKQTIPELASKKARLVIVARRPLLFGLRTRESTHTAELPVRLEPPRIAVVSMHHFVNHGGSELVVYRADPPDIDSGVRVGDLTYPGYPAAGAGIQGADSRLKVALFALRFDQDLSTPIELYATDEAGNQARATFAFRVFPKPYKRSRIELEDTFLQRVVPAIFERTPELKSKIPSPDDVLTAFLAINGDLRRQNAERILAIGKDTARTVLWQGPFKQLTNSKVESSFADHRTYFYNGREVDQQVHLGFDLAVTANIPIVVANAGRVVFADYLGIYGNCVIVDHGMGVQSLYAHLSSFDVKTGDVLQKDQTVGRSGMTGLAGGDHLHFTMLVHGQPVTPIDWWSTQWIEDRILRKLREAAKPAGT